MNNRIPPLFERPVSISEPIVEDNWAVSEDEILFLLGSSQPRYENLSLLRYISFKMR